MCAINGFSYQNRSLMEKMNVVTRHRGPDGTGIYDNPRMTLGHNRLAIIDTRDIASQPMKSVDGRYVIVFNGEIYNFEELKKKFADYPYKTKSDTEVILAGFYKKGVDFIKELNGIFAFAIWDNQEKIPF